MAGNATSTSITPSDHSLQVIPNTKLLWFQLNQVVTYLIEWMKDLDSEEREDRSSHTDDALPSLLSCLCAPTPSELAQKRKVRANPPKGIKRGKGYVSTDPKSVSPEDRVKAYPSENLTVSIKNLFCTACREEVALKKSVIESHVSSQKHKRG